MSVNAVFEALAHPARRKILRLLREGPLSAGAIAGHFALTKPTLSSHFNKLKQAELVTADRQGTSLIYQLNAAILEDAIASLVALKDSDNGP
ncbi:MAG TPA: metalloregulator ArsR/SmtB family transcription factor [Devosiaceae bacterium]|jgi:DNA-binding transcriptional ArsR family regulator|nr:metalloregulator ArsR/SmtB family transcription factor [Devosiaceae bacterium]